MLSCARVMRVRAPLHTARQLTLSMLMPFALTWSSGSQHSSIWSENHRQTVASPVVGLTHGRPGSTSSAFRTMARLPRPQKAGSACVS